MKTLSKKSQWVEISDISSKKKRKIASRNYKKLKQKNSNKLIAK